MSTFTSASTFPICETSLLPNLPTVGQMLVGVDVPWSVKHVRELGEHGTCLACAVDNVVVLAFVMSHNVCTSRRSQK